jgi:hypothetical protein
VRERKERGRKEGGAVGTQVDRGLLVDPRPDQSGLEKVKISIQEAERVTRG